MNTLEGLIESARMLVHELMSKEPGMIGGRSHVPSAGGVYVIYENGAIIYIGKAGDLRKRICGQHLSKATKAKTSAFRRSLSVQRLMPFGPGMRTWILTNCSFDYLQVSDPDMCGLVESLAIALRRTPALLNA